jgi:hypothetical protein
MSNRVLTGMVAAATATLLLGGGIARAAGLGPAPVAPPHDALSQTLPAEAHALVPIPVVPAAPAPRAVVPVPAPVGPAAPSSKPHDTVVTQAPPGGASASVLQVNPLDTCISCTSASAGPGTATAKATAIRLLGNNIEAGSGNSGSNSGALLAIPASPLATLAIATWMYHASPGSSSAAHSRASLVDLTLGPNGHQSGGLITLAVLESTSDAGYQGLSSGGTGANNGVDLNAGDGALVVLLLHSDASSANRGSAYVIGINGNKILGTEQTGAGGIPIAVPGVIGLILLQVNAGGGAASSSIGSASDLLGQTGQAAGLLTASAVGLTGTGLPSTGTASTATAPNTGAGLSAPNTGMALGVSGLVILPAGLALLFLSLRRRRDATG